MSSDVETNIVAVEKVKEYSDTEKEVQRNKNGRDQTFVFCVFDDLVISVVCKAVIEVIK